MDQHEDQLAKAIAAVRELQAAMQAMIDALPEDADDDYASYQRHHINLALISLGSAHYDLLRAQDGHNLGTPEWWAARRNLLIEVPF